MSIETQLYSTLAANSGVTSLVGTRIYPNKAPDSAQRPCISYMVVSGTRINTLPGTGDAVKKRIQVSCHADLYSAAKSVANAVMAALEGDGYLELEWDMYDPQTQVYTVMVDWSFMSVS